MSHPVQAASTPAPIAREIAAIVLAGALLGLGYNAFGLESTRRWGLPWIGSDRLAALEVVSDGSPPSAAAADPYRTEVDDPLAVASADPVRPALPEIPAAGRPVQIELGPLKSYVDARAALVIDARDRAEFEAGHIPGAVHLAYDEAATDPARLEALDSGGRPIVVYCGGGSCELSLNLAYELVAAGHARVAVFMGGYPAWTEAGYPVESARAGR